MDNECVKRKVLGKEISITEARELYLELKAICDPNYTDTRFPYPVPWENPIKPMYPGYPEYPLVTYKYPYSGGCI